MSNDHPELPRAKNLDLSKLSYDEILELRNRVLSEAKDRFDGGHGPRPTLGTDDGTFFAPEDAPFVDWWDWVEQIIRTISDGLTRVALGLTSAGFAIAAALMYNTRDGIHVADLIVCVAATFAAIFALLTLRSVLRRR